MREPFLAVARERPPSFLLNHLNNALVSIDPDVVSRFDDSRGILIEVGYGWHLHDHGGKDRQVIPFPVDEGGWVCAELPGPSVSCKTAGAPGFGEDQHLSFERTLV